MVTEGGNVNSLTETTKSWWQEFSLRSLSENIGGSSAEAVQAALFFGISFGLGFLFKKYGKFLFIVLVITGITLKVLEYNNWVTINWDILQSALGMEAGFDVEFKTLYSGAYTWIKDNILVTIATLLGFVVGYKLA